MSVTCGVPKSVIRGNYSNSSIKKDAAGRSINGPIERAILKAFRAGRNPITFVWQYPEWSVVRHRGGLAVQSGMTGRCCKAFNGPDCSFVCL